IEARVEEMFRRGALEEVKRIIATGLPPDATIWQSLGIEEMRPCLEGKATADEAGRALIRSTKAYAKRQMTWFRRDARIRWLQLPPDEPPRATAERIIRLLKQG
ncbi:MAG: tRNA dimethylallyltransferase, partial [Candidatus Aureabacteria bacterium]|nr:tRNA dimethylallyltransferase [Candidatus Auribacterota bacterium]